MQEIANPHPDAIIRSMHEPSSLRLGVNIDHVATLRNARGGTHPDPVRAALLARDAGADGITAHLSEDRRHIRDADIARLMKEVDLPLNLEMAATEEMIAIALRTKPHAVCIVPEKRQERTTEGGLDVKASIGKLRDTVTRLKGAGIRVSLFINPALPDVEAAEETGAQVVELHTGRYCEEAGKRAGKELEHIKNAAADAVKLGLECHAGHGLSFDTVKPVAAMPEMMELNIGHSLIGEAVFEGLTQSILRMKQLMREART
jgi:pyridoxine 5-phosphate synthase